MRLSLRPALFLDRDGVINIDHAYVSTQEQFEFIDGIFDLCAYAKQLGCFIFVITNQAGIGRGYYTEQDFLELTKWMCGIFEAQGITIDKVYFCPFHPEYGIGKYKIDSPMRKPNPGMILQAAQEHNIDLKNSVLIGDKESDVQAGLAAGIGCNLLYSALASEVQICGLAQAKINNLADARHFLERGPKHSIKQPL